ncbi:hypothetical protein DEU56DRAFT_889432 [Suillus clintonianus]|uniref:uncharacterized protein n=1 Tax=Suillus clintonianus TaxID=1904413 RepID=UPI001B876196|nr:uncharacterized protein DEU56DRAFT_889432 [Suillus clintonianus]KAG2132092.1 hypothetical protein DEU56DRAFT_889432 [Suillus clintonianus]
MDFDTAYHLDLLGHIEYRSAKPIKAYEKWFITSIDTVIKPIETTIRASDDLAEFRQNVKDGVDEEYLYSPLQEIFRMIEGAAAEVTGYKRTQFRQLVSMSDHVPDAENMSFPHNKPDFVLAEVPPTSSSLTPAIDVGSDGVKWRQISGFIEVKPNVREGPNVTEPTSVKQIVSQGADYARLIMAARPFQLYVLCVFIYGHKFSLGWYDRRGVIISDDYDILDNLDIFVNVILQLTTHMTTYQLGHDRSARLLEGQSYYQFEYPSFLVSTGAAGDTRLWKTKGPPVWSSLSLLGRGTATWRATLLDNNPNKKEVLVILKTLWRSQTLESESDVYRHIKSPLPGVAELSLGDDVCIPVAMETHARVTISTLRSLILDDDAVVLDDPVLHRLALKTVGLPLWDAGTTKDFILGSLAALKGHQGLVEQGILHRDMNPGNIFIGGPDCAEGWEGFLADLELASVAQSETETVVSLHPLSPSAGQLSTRDVFVEETGQLSSKAPGAEITGTALFMAEELLSMMLHADKSKKNIRPAAIKREVRHDLESFILVLFYSVMKRGLERRLWHKEPYIEFRIQQLYSTLFGGHTVWLIRKGRSCFFDESDPPVYLFDALDPPTHRLLYGCWKLLKIQRSSNFPYNEYRAKVDQKMQWASGSEELKVITYAQLYKVYEIAMRVLSS